MRTMMDLLVSLRRMETAAEDADRNQQLSPGEKHAVRRHVNLVQEIIPPEVLTQYNDQKTTSRELLDAPELFAMSVLLATYRDLSPTKRKKLLQHFRPASNSTFSVATIGCGQPRERHTDWRVQPDAPVLLPLPSRQRASTA